MIAAVVLAAGRSERMGRPKPLLPCGERSFLQSILDTVDASAVDVVRVVLGHAAGKIRDALALPDGIVAVNDHYDQGMLSSVQCGIRLLPLATRAFLLWPVDHPLVRVETVNALVEAHLSQDPPIALPLYAGRRGHPVLFSARLAAELMEAPPTQGARAVVHAHAADLAEIPVEDPGVVTDIDTPDAYESAFGRPLPCPAS
jgi:molybdenum cofactor cytidylyltransferase